MTPETNKCRKNHTLTKLLEDDKKMTLSSCVRVAGGEQVLTAI